MGVRAVSYIFEFQDDVIWSPAMRVGRLLVGFANSLAATVPAPHGLSASAADHYYVDDRQFHRFVEVVDLEYGSGHPSADGLLRGFRLTSLVLLERMGIDVTPMAGPEELHAVIELSTAMARL
jgi:uncharacterized protein DUF6086